MNNTIPSTNPDAHNEFFVSSTDNDLSFIRDGVIWSKIVYLPGAVIVQRVHTDPPRYRRENVKAFHADEIQAAKEEALAIARENYNNWKAANRSESLDFEFECNSISTSDVVIIKEDLYKRRPTLFFSIDGKVYTKLVFFESPQKCSTLYSIYDPAIDKFDPISKTYSPVLHFECMALS